MKTDRFFTIRTIFLLLLINITTSINAEEFNLDFEQIEDGMPMKWFSRIAKGYKKGIDDQNKHNGSYAVFIESVGKGKERKSAEPFEAWASTIPAIYKGQKIKLTGYIKTEIKRRKGRAGLWLRIDPELGFSNAPQIGITSSTEWQKYEIELDLNEDSATLIAFGGFLEGMGKMWLDNLTLSIDGVPIDQAPLRELSTAEKDKAFDQGSQINIQNISSEQINNLEILGKVWGFLKYHHPKIAAGDLNWDYELFRLLPNYLTTPDSNARDQLLIEWIDSLGMIDSCTECAKSYFGAALSPDHEWINHGISSELKEKLEHIYKNRTQGKHYYLGFELTSNAKFSHESSYSNMPFPDDGFRLLAVYRYWNMIHYYFPYKHLTENDWNHVLRRYIPKFLTAADELQYETVVLELIGEVNDSHATLDAMVADKINETKGEYFPPVHVKFIGEQLVVADYYNTEMREQVGLEVGDVITHINDQPVELIIENNKTKYPASNHSGYLRNLSMDVLRSHEENIQLKVVRKSEILDKKIPTFAKNEINHYFWYRLEPNAKSYKMLDNNIGYINLKNIKKEDVDTIKKEMIKAKGIIIDIRNYPSAFVPYSLGSFFMATKQPFAKFTAPVPDNPGAFFYKGQVEIEKSENSFQGPLVIIVNEITQSMAEFTTMAFQAGQNTTVIGSMTAGADGNISMINLPGGLSTAISGLGVYYPDGTETQRVGVMIDQVIHPTIKGIAQGRDELLEKAIEIIHSNRN